jgi:hypothetical protein
VRRPRRRWATVQDSRPFLYKEWSHHWTRWGAHMNYRSNYPQIQVMRVDRVAWLNERLKERAVFDEGGVSECIARSNR